VKGIGRPLGTCYKADDTDDVYDKTGRNHRGRIDTISGKKNYPDRGLTDMKRQGDGVFLNRNPATLA
jgi:hypothetical protein